MTLAACWRTCLDVVLPPVCLLCGDDQPAGDLCRRCDRLLHASWPALAVPCRFCGMPAPRWPDSEGSPDSETGPRRQAQPCAACPAAGFGFDCVTPLAVYQGPVREAVVATKRMGNAALAAALGARLAQQVLNQMLDDQIRYPERGQAWPELVTFVPTSPWRRLQRGGSSGPACIAAAVGQRLSLPTVEIVRQTRRIAKQSLLPDELRQQNVRDAFATKRSYAWKPLPQLRDRHILLVDDVLTTGSTASEVTAVLKRAGAASVHLAVVARAVRR